MSSWLLNMAGKSKGAEITTRPTTKRREAWLLVCGGARDHARDLLKLLCAFALLRMVVQHGCFRGPMV
jgi:hypothetical protein